VAVIVPRARSILSSRRVSEFRGTTLRKPVIISRRTFTGMWCLFIVVRVLLLLLMLLMSHFFTTLARQSPEENPGDGREQQRWKEGDDRHHFHEDEDREIGPVQDANEDRGNDRSREEDESPHQNGRESIEPDPLAEIAAWGEPILETSETVSDGGEGTLPCRESEEIPGHGWAGHRVQLHKSLPFCRELGVRIRRHRSSLFWQWIPSLRPEGGRPRPRHR